MRKSSFVMTQSLHTQIRYSIDFFIIQWARNIKGNFKTYFFVLTFIFFRNNFWNLFVGNYSVYYFTKLVRTKVTSTIRNFLTSTLPWQRNLKGFHRAIAKLLAHIIVPLVFKKMEYYKKKIPVYPSIYGTFRMKSLQLNR